MTDKQIIAARVLSGFTAADSFRKYGGDTVSHRECVNKDTDEWRMVTHEEAQNREIAHYIALSYKIAEEFLKYGEQK